MYSEETTEIKGVYVLTPQVFVDDRGAFFESSNVKSLQDIGIDFHYEQENFMQNDKAGVFRGLHFQVAPYEQAKVVRCVKGNTWNVAVDLRSDSSTYLHWVAVELTAENLKQLYIPKGFAHGVLSLEDDTEILCYTDEIWEPEAERTIRYDDPDINIQYPIDKLILSDKDRNAPYWRECDVSSL